MCFWTFYSALHYLIFLCNVHSSSTGHGHRNNLAPQTMQWAIRNHETGARAGGNGAPCAFLYYLSDSHTLKLLDQILREVFK